MTAARPVSAQQLCPVLRPVVGTRPDRTARFVGGARWLGCRPAGTYLCEGSKRGRKVETGTSRAYPVLPGFDARLHLRRQIETHPR